jgi:hypothetical protein
MYLDETFKVVIAGFGGSEAAIGYSTSPDQINTHEELW